MKKGFHSVKSGFSENYDFSNPRLHRMDNGDYKSNFYLQNIELLPQNNSRVGGNQDALSADTIFFVVATTSAGALPAAAIVSDMTWDSFDLRLADSRQIAWGVLNGAKNFHKVVIDPGHIIVDDIYVNCWSFSTGGSLVPAVMSLGYLLTLRNITESGTEGLLHQVAQSAVE